MKDGDNVLMLPIGIGGFPFTCRDGRGIIQSFPKGRRREPNEKAMGNKDA